MSNTMKIILFVAIGIVCAVALFCLAVVIACSVNGLTFGEQICEWFGRTAPEIIEEVGQVEAQITNIATH